MDSAHQPISVIRQYRRCAGAKHTLWERGRVKVGLCVKCSKPVAGRSGRYCEEHRLSTNARSKERYLANKALANYRTKISGHRSRIRLFVELGGLKCVGCGERDYRVLSLDHRDGHSVVQHGSRHRRGTTTADLWKITRGEISRADLRVLCVNCQARNEYRRGKRVIYPEVKIAVIEAGGFVGEDLPP